MTPVIAFNEYLLLLVVWLYMGCFPYVVVWLWLLLFSGLACPKKKLYLSGSIWLNKAANGKFYLFICLDKPKNRLPFRVFFFLNLKCIHSIETPKILKQIFKMPSCVNVIFFKKFFSFPPPRSWLHTIICARNRASKATIYTPTC